MTKEEILGEIRRTAAENGGVALGSRRFEKLVGIPTSAWRGKHWRAWSDAVEEAGLPPNLPAQPLEERAAVEHLARLTRKNRSFPSYADIRLAREADKKFPSHHAFGRLGSWLQNVERVRRLAQENRDFEDVLAYLPKSDPIEGKDSTDARVVDGFVYMERLGRSYKIGRTNSVHRRHKEISIALPEETKPIHEIRTDDPVGIEAYWHKRFEAKRQKGEWFALSAEDVRAFKKRKSM